MNNHRAFIDAEERAKAGRWAYKGLARVTHPARGSVVVPCGSKLSAIECAAEYWGCDTAEIMDSTVMATEPEAVPVQPPPGLLNNR